MNSRQDGEQEYALETFPRPHQTDVEITKDQFSVHSRPIRAQQPRYLQRCTDDLYQWQSRARAAQKPFILHDGPPYANGGLHIGHALNKILKDLIVRAKLQQGHRVLFVPGWDCHGLPIEIKAVKEMKSLRKAQMKAGLEEIGPQLMDFDIRFHARKLAGSTVELQKEEFRSWGIMADWGNAWRTMDKNYVFTQLDVFRKMVSKGLIYRKYKPVHWSPSSRTALAEAELDKLEKADVAAFIMFPLLAIPLALDKKVPRLRDLSVVIWTTLPWTLPANRAIAVNKDTEYTIVRFRANDLLIASSRVEYFEKMCCEGELLMIISTSVMGSDLMGAQYVNAIHGIDSESRSIIHADFVTEDSGTGIVHLAPGHGADDYKVCASHGIEAWAPVDNLGCYTMEALPRNPYALYGTSVLGAGNDVVLKLMHGFVLGVHLHRKQCLFDWRTKGPTFERATAQWFADVESIKGDALERLKDVRFIPETGRARLESFVKGRSEWCISRQRPWGVPIPALFDKGGNAELDSRVVNHIKSCLDRREMDSWWLDEPSEQDWIPPNLRDGPYTRGKDTMDVWFDSGTSWTQMPTGIDQADVYVEGTDQHRGWFQSTLLTHTSASSSTKAPYKLLITHGFTLDQNGRKMSKSEGNVTHPDEIMKGTMLPPVKSRKSGLTRQGEYTESGLGVDALRLWVASSDYTKDVTLGTTVQVAINKALIKYRVTLRLLLGTMTSEARTKPVTLLDQIALNQLIDVMQVVSAAYRKFEFYKAIHEINRWINNDLSAFYLDALKDRLYCGDGGGVLEEIFHGLLRMLSPITPCLVEEAWSYRAKWMLQEEHFHVANQSPAARHPMLNSLEDEIIRPERLKIAPNLLESLQSIKSEIQWISNAKIATNAVLEEARKSKHITTSLASTIVLTIPNGDLPLFEKYATELADIFVVSSVRFGDVTDLGVNASLFWAAFDTPGGSGRISMLPADYSTRCARCWKYNETLDDDLCKRCSHAVNEHCKKEIAS